MREIAIVLAENTERKIFVAIAFFAVVFLLRFLVALLLEEKRTRERSRDRQSATRVGVPRIPSHTKALAVERGRIGGTLSNPEPRLLRPSYKQVDNRNNKLRWLLMALGGGMTLRFSRQRGWLD
jgi:hypothetical protein